MHKKIGILLTNTGTPDAATTSAVRRYLREFLSDRRIVHLPRMIWLPILYGLVLTFRPRKSKKLYERIWMKDGAPMRIYMKSLREKLEKKISANIEIAMNYGNPSITNALQQFQDKNIEKIIVIPLYPQYSNTTTASTYDRVVSELKKWKALPTLNFIRDYHTHPNYIDALCDSVIQHWQQHGKKHLLISFHGIPKRFVTAGDPYEMQCEATTKALSEKLQLQQDEFTLCYQSQFGYDQWLQPATNTILKNLAAKKIHDIDIICPGFAIDCLETLEEIKIRSLEIFHKHGGKALNYIPALNANENQVNLILNLINGYI